VPEALSDLDVHGTRRCGSGTPRQERCKHSRATRARSSRWPSRQTARGWCPGHRIKRCGSAILHEFLQKSSPSSQGPQVSEEDVPGGTDRRRRYRKAGHHFSEDAEPSRDMHVEVLAEDIVLFDYSLYGNGTITFNSRYHERTKNY
jgi:hypothetical protein